MQEQDGRLLLNQADESSQFDPSKRLPVARLTSNWSRTNSEQPPLERCMQAHGALFAICTALAHAL